MIIDKIREATLVQHLQLEECILLRHFSGQTITRPLYAGILKKLYDFFHPLELTLNRYSEINVFLPDYYQRRKSSALMEDLQVINGSFTEPGHCARLPVINNVGKAFGCLYMMEGSALRGEIIPAILNDKLGVGNHTGAKFFHGYGPDTVAKWKAFLEALRLFSTRYNNDEDIITGATDTFKGLQAWMND